ncbi:hypothetical protein J4225_00110 [Candidatus Pacearchaeota archaeon]|nr:hypothetical protein [Candidatus Pacearchaeota archaeon]
MENSKITNKYFRYVFESELIQRHLTIVSRGVAIKNVPSVKELKEIKFPVSKFSVIDKVEETVNQSLIKAEKLRKSILKSAFEGKLVQSEHL